MINFPIFHHLKGQGYLLFPGRNGTPGIDVTFGKGPTLIAGVNGLGKSTFITILLRILTGPFDISPAAQDGDLTEAESKPTNLRRPRDIFPPRVADGAESAVAHLEVGFGSARIEISRRLNDLELISCRCRGEDVQIEDEKSYQSLVIRLMGVGNFFDFLLILRYVVFFMEDRRALVWGKTAQREILRALFVAPAAATKLSFLRSDMVSADSAYRNARNQLRRQIYRNNQEIHRVSKVSNVRGELTVRIAHLDALRNREAGLEISIADEDEARLKARLRGAKGALNLDSAVRELERAKVHLLRSEFDALEESGIYVLARLMSDDECLMCSTQLAGLGDAMSKRLENGNCPLCNTPRDKDSRNDIVKLTPKRIEELQAQIQLSELQVRKAADEIERANQARAIMLEELSETSIERIRANQSIISLREQLPTEDREVTELEEQNKALEEVIENERKIYEKARAKYQTGLTKSEAEVARDQKKVANAFSNFAAEFLKEQCHIAFQPVSIQIGQTGSRFEIGLYQLSMTGAALAGATQRSGPDEVSMSQREFLDLAFRMALMTVASGNKAATLLVDAPESSLDFLFAKRAGNQLAKFAMAGGKTGNRVIVTSNLGNEDLIPALLKGRPAKTKAASRVINLLEIAEPNEALKDDYEAYSKFIKKQIRRS